jgi:YegS/Rv2252/BmrU family lipid kinase
MLAEDRIEVSTVLRLRPRAGPFTRLATAGTKALSWALTMTERAQERPLLIVNPRSGGGQTGKIFDAMRAPLERALGDFDVAFTERGRHAVDLARDAAIAGRALLIAVGGDGTIHEVVNGLMEAREKGGPVPRLGIIGQGTGGDFRRTLGIEHRLDRYCAAIAGGRTRRVDVGRATFVAHDGAKATSFFNNILSVGIGGIVDQLVAEASRGLGGTFAYYSASFRGLLKSEIGVLACTLSLAGQERRQEVTTRNLAICNGRYFGSGMKVAPMAEPDDGTFEVVSLGAASKLRFAIESSTRIYTGEHIGKPGIEHFRCDKIKVELLNGDIADRFLLDVDGEPLGRLPMEIELIPGAVEVLVPSPP